MTVAVVKDKLFWIRENFIRFPLYILSSPFKGFDDMKFQNLGKLSFGIVGLALLSLLNILKYSYTGFLINENNPYYMNSLLIIATTILPILLFAIANWSVTTLMNGIGKFKEIFLVNMYAMYFTIPLNIIFILLSNVLTESEMPIALFFSSLGTIVYCFYVFIGLTVIHEFSFFRTIGSIMLTFLAMAIIIFVAMLLSSLVGEVVQFLITVFKEIRLKLI